MRSVHKNDHSDYNAVLDIYTNYGRQPKPKKTVENDVSSIAPAAVEIDLDPFAYLL